MVRYGRVRDCGLPTFGDYWNFYLARMRGERALRRGRRSRDKLGCWAPAHPAPLSYLWMPSKGSIAVMSSPEREPPVAMAFWRPRSTWVVVHGVEVAELVKIHSEGSRQRTCRTMCGRTHLRFVLYLADGAEVELCDFCRARVPGLDVPASGAVYRRVMESISPTVKWASQRSAAPLR